MLLNSMVFLEKDTHITFQNYSSIILRYLNKKIKLIYDLFEITQVLEILKKLSFTRFLFANFRKHC